MVATNPVSENDSNADRANPATTDDAPPTITIIDNVEKKSVIMPRRACGCLPERTVVIAILTCYFFFGIIRAAAYFSGLAFTHDLRDQVMFTIFAVTSVSFAIASAIGMNAIYKENAILMRRLSILFVVLTLVVFALNSTDFIIDVATRDSIRNQCLDEVAAEKGQYAFLADNVNCDRVVKMFLVKEGIEVFFFSFIQFYFAHVILKHAREMTSQIKHPHPLVSQNGDAPPTYFVYASGGVPTADNWVPPPSYNGNPNNIRLAEDTKFANDAANHA